MRKFVSVYISYGQVKKQRDVKKWVDYPKDKKYF
jgi:hypothetical protein